MVSVRLASIAVFASAVIFFGGLAASSKSASNHKARSLAIDTNYRSRAASHKVIVYANEQELRDLILAAGGSVIEEYGAFSLMNAPASAAEQVSAQSAGSLVRDDMNLILLRAVTFDTTEGEPSVPESLDSQPTDQLHLVQMIGPIKREWVEQLERAVEVVSYIPNNAYLVKADQATMPQIRSLTSSGKPFVQWTGPYKPAYKIAPEIHLESNEEISVTIQIFTSDRNAALNVLSGFGQVLGEPIEILNYTNVKLKTSAQLLADIARINDVIWIEPLRQPELYDERQDQIVAGNTAGGQLTGPGYLAWLKARGLASIPDFVIDLADTGIDRGILDPAVLHKCFLNPAGVPRIAYARFVGAPGMEGDPNDPLGHGTINASIAGGYVESPSFPDADAEGYRFGLGIHPFAKLGITKVFAPDWTNPSYTAMYDQMYRDGARISNNSWGTDANLYTTVSQTYDALVRDSQSGTQGNQEMCIVFAAGNKGQGGHIGSPATAKNVIAVGASQNYRISGVVDGCGVADDGANDINAITNFSSGGPVQDGRVKPDIVAPGTHIQGAASQDSAYATALSKLGVCNKYFPAGQTLYTWSSGTSHSAPAVAAAAALVRQYFQQYTGRAPSPAMIKAYLTNSTTYLTGPLAGGNLPSNSQGWGLLNLNRAFDAAPRILVDQSQLFTSTGQAYTIHARVNDTSRPLRITLAWTDAPGAVGANPVVNDLDLQVELGGKTYFGNHFNGPVSVTGGPADKLNNVESVWLPEGTSGEFTIRIIAANITGDGVPGNGNPTDQDFALIAYNAQPLDAVDAPPQVRLKYPVGGERLNAGSTVRIQWDSSDDKGIQSQRVEFSADGGANYDTLAVLDGKAHSFDWRVPQLLTSRGRIKVTALDGVNLPVASISPGDFEIVIGPPDTIPPVATVIFPTDGSIVPGGSTVTIKWMESDNVGVVKRVLELSTDGGDNFLPLATIVAPNTEQQASFDWPVPAALSTIRGKLRITVYDGAGNFSTTVSPGKFQVWPLPIISKVDYNTLKGGKAELVIAGRAFREGQTEIYVDDVEIGKLRYYDKFDEGDGTFYKIISNDKKLDKRVPVGKWVNIVAKLPQTGQTSPPFAYKRKKSD
jgi:hypothetical protein